MSRATRATDRRATITLGRSKRIPKKAIAPGSEKSAAAMKTTDAGSTSMNAPANAAAAMPAIEEPMRTLAIALARSVSG